MNIQPQPDPREQLTEPRRALYDTVRQVAERTGRDCADILCNDCGTFAITAGSGDVAAVEAAPAGEPATVSLPGCGRAAAHRVEVYSPRDGHAHGSLDASLYVCAEHHAAVRAALGAAGLTPFTVRGTIAGPKRCGDGYDFIAGRPVTAPAPTGEAHVSPSGQVQRLDTGEWVPADGAEPDPAGAHERNRGPDVRKRRALVDARPAGGPVVDPYRVVNLILAELSGVQPGIVFTAAQLGEAAVFASALLAALGAVPAVDGDPGGRHAGEGAALRAGYRSTRPYRPGVPGHHDPFELLDAAEAGRLHEVAGPDDSMRWTPGTGSAS